MLSRMFSCGSSWQLLWLLPRQPELLLVFPRGPLQRRPQPPTASDSFSHPQSFRRLINLSSHVINYNTAINISYMKSILKSVFLSTQYSVYPVCPSCPTADPPLPPPEPPWWQKMKLAWERAEKKSKWPLHFHSSTWRREVEKIFDNWNWQLQKIIRTFSLYYFPIEIERYDSKPLTFN